MGAYGGWWTDGKIMSLPFDKKRHHLKAAPAKSCRGGLILAALACLVVSCGCVQIRDGISRAIGAPTETEISQVLDQVRGAEVAVAELELRMAEAERAEQIEQEQATAMGLQAQLLRDQIGRLAGQLADATGVAWQALHQTLARMVSELESIETGVDRHTQVARGYAGIMAEIRAEVERQRFVLADAEMELEGFGERSRQAISAAAGGVRLAGEAARDLGIPGAKLIGDQIAAAGSGLLALLMGGGAALQTVRHRRERKRRRGLDEVVHANEVFGLIRDNEVAKRRAASSLSPEARAALALAKAGATIVPFDGAG